MSLSGNSIKMHPNEFALKINLLCSHMATEAALLIRLSVLYGASVASNVSALLLKTFSAR